MRERGDEPPKGHRRGPVRALFARSAHRRSSERVASADLPWSSSIAGRLSSPEGPTAGRQGGSRSDERSHGRHARRLRAVRARATAAQPPAPDAAGDPIGDETARIPTPRSPGRHGCDGCDSGHAVGGPGCRRGGPAGGAGSRRRRAGADPGATPTERSGRSGGRPLGRDGRLGRAAAEPLATGNARLGHRRRRDPARAWILDGFFGFVLIFLGAIVFGDRDRGSSAGFGRAPCPSWAYLVVVLGFYFVYFVGFWTSKGKATPGMRLFKLQVANAADGKRLEIGPAVDPLAGARLRHLDRRRSSRSSVRSRRSRPSSGRSCSSSRRARTRCTRVSTTDGRRPSSSDPKAPVPAAASSRCLIVALDRHPVPLPGADRRAHLPGQPGQRRSSRRSANRSDRSLRSRPSARTLGSDDHRATSTTDRSRPGLRPERHGPGVVPARRACRRGRDGRLSRWRSSATRCSRRSSLGSLAPLFPSRRPGGARVA